MEDHDVRDLMARLMKAVESSLGNSTAVREALTALGRQGYEARLFFVANAESGREAADDEGAPASAEDPDEEADEVNETPVVREIGAVVDGGDLEFELTKLDRDFLKSLNIRPDNS